MTEEEQVKENTQKELQKSKSCNRLKDNPDFQVFREILDAKLNEYRTMLEERPEDDRSNILRGGIVSIKDVLSLFDVTAGRENSLIEFLEQFKE